MSQDEVPVVWSPSTRRHDPRHEVWVGVPTPGTEVAARVDLADDGRDAEGVEHLANEVDQHLRDEVSAVSEVFLHPTPR